MAPKGNKNAVGNKGGAPRTVSPSPEDCIKLGEEMLEWVRKNKPTHLSEWFSLEKRITWKVWLTMTETPEFLPFYEQAIWMVSKNIRTGILDKSLAQRFLSLYHRDLRRYEREIKEEDVALQSGHAAVDQATIANTIAVLNQLTGAQEARKAAESSNSTDCKS